METTFSPVPQSRDPRPLLLVTGAAGGLANIVVSRLTQEFRLLGVDTRHMPKGRNFPGEFFQIDYSHRRMTDLFRTHSIHALLHIGRVWNPKRSQRSTNYRINVLGTRNLLEQARRHGVKHLIVVSTFHVYGAHQHNHVYITEDEALRASQIFPELVDAIELDHAATTFLWRYRDLRTIVIRPCSIIGASIQNTISGFLRSRVCPTLMGYDPLMQFIHEQDIASAIATSLKGTASGIYNLAGEGVVPYSRAIELAGSTPFPVLSPLAYSLMGILSRLELGFPKHLIDYFKYPTVISDAAFRRDFDWKPMISTRDALRSLRPEP